LGDTEDEHTRLNSRIHEVLSELWLLRTEIEEWYGIESLPKVIRDELTVARELPDLMTSRGYNNTFINMSNYIIRDLENASGIELDEENWPTINQLIRSAGDKASMILRLLGHKIDQQCRDRLLTRVAAMPAELEAHLESLQNTPGPNRDLDMLSRELRM